MKQQQQSEKKKLSELSPYYNREFYHKRSLAEEMQIFRWLQLLQQHYQIFNVDNYHDCIRAEREEKEYATLYRCQPRTVIVKPFQSIDNFYGCVICGKYHICQLSRETCPLIIDDHDKQKACSYSGKLLVIQDNLEATFEDGAHADKESTFLLTPFSNNKRRNNTSPKKSRSSPKKSKKPQRAEIQDRFVKEDDAEEAAVAVEDVTVKEEMNLASNGKKRLRLSDECRTLIKDAYDLSIESLSEIDEDDDMVIVVVKEAKTTTTTTPTNGNDDDDEETEEIKKEREDRPLKRARRLEKEKKEAHECKEEAVEIKKIIEEEDVESCDIEDAGDVGDEEDYKEWLSVAATTTTSNGGCGGGGNEHENDSAEEYAAACGSILEYDNENGEGDRTKNYHNNIRYNNEYYAFLKPIIRKQEKKARHSSIITPTINDDDYDADDDDMDQYDRFMDLYKRDIHFDERFNQRITSTPIHVEDDDEKEAVVAVTVAAAPTVEINRGFGENQKLGESAYNKILKETATILNVLIKIDPVKRPHCKLKTSLIHQKLMEYFVPLIQNITLLVYQSPVIAKLAMIRCTKNQNQVPKFGVSVLDLESVENLQSDVDYHEYTLCPLKIVRALMLHLFVQPFSLTDTHGYKIDIWYRDQWLNTFNRGGGTTSRAIHQQSLCGDYFKYASRNDLIKSSIESHQFKKELQETSALINDSLCFYKFCPLWLRHMVLNGHEDENYLNA